MKTHYDQSDVGRKTGWLHPLFKPLLTILIVFLLGFSTSAQYAITGSSFCWDGTTKTDIGCSGAETGYWYVLYHFYDNGTWERQAFFLNNSGNNPFIFVQDYGDALNEDGLFVVYKYDWTHYAAMMADPTNANLIAGGSGVIQRQTGEIWIYESPVDQTLQPYGTQGTDYTVSGSAAIYCDGSAGVTVASSEASQFSQWIPYGIIPTDQWKVKYVVFDGTTRVDSAYGDGNQVDFQSLDAAPTTYTATAYRGSCAGLPLGESVEINDQARVKNVTKGLCYLTINEALADASMNNTLYLLKDEAYPEDVNIILDGITIMSDPANPGHFMTDIQGSVSIAADNVTLNDIDGIYTSTASFAIMIGDGDNYTIDSIFWIQGLDYGLMITSNVGGGHVTNSTFTANPVGIQINGDINGILTISNNKIEGPNPAVAPMIGINNFADNVVVDSCGNFNFYSQGIANGGADNVTIHHCNFTNIDINGNGVIGSGANVSLYHNDFSYFPNDSVVVAINSSTNYNAENNWYGKPAGPTIPTNPCGNGSQVLGGAVDYSPWYYEAAMTTKNGLPPITLTDVPDMSTITKTPLILTTNASYPNDIADYNTNVKTDARITSGIKFPAGSKVIKVIYNGGTIFSGNYLLPDTTFVYLSDILGGSAPLAGHNGLSIDWKVYLAGFDSPWTSTLTLDAVSYIGDKSACNNVLGSDPFDVAFDDAEMAIDSTTGTNKNVVCTEVDPLKFDVFITYPAISGVNSDIKADAKITSDVAIPELTPIEIKYNGTPVTTYYVPAGGASTFYLHDMLGLAEPLPLQGNADTAKWSFEIASDASLIGSYHLTIKALAILESTEYMYAEKNLGLTVHPLPTANISVAAGYSNHICLDSAAMLRVQLTGTGPWDYILTDGTTPDTIHQLAADSSFSRIHLTNKTWSITSVNDIHCTDTPSTSVKIYIGTITYVGQPYPAPFCEGDSIFVPITAKGFEDVGVLSLTLKYNQAALEYLTFTKKHLDFPFTANGDSAGVVKMGGFGSIAYQMPDNDTLFTIVFRSKGLSTQMAWENVNPASCEYVSFETGLPFCDVPNNLYYIDLPAPGLVQHKRPKATMSGTTTICNGSSGNLNVHLVGTAPWTFRYTINTLDTATIVIPTGTDPYDYTLTVSPSGVGDYTYVPIAVQDANGCNAIDTLDLAGSGLVHVKLQPIIDNVSIGHITCNSANDGYVNLEVLPAVGTINYFWSGPSSFTASTKNISGLSDGTYYVTASNSDATCTATGNYVINRPPVLNAAVSKTDAICYGDGNGKISITNPTGGISGAGSGYDFRIIKGTDTSSWNSYVSNPLEFTGLNQGTYQVWVRDKLSLNCKLNLGDQTINQMAQLTADLTQDSATCPGITTGKVNISNPAGGAYPGDPAPTDYQFRLMVGATQIYGWTNYTSGMSFSGCNSNSYTVEMRRSSATICAASVGNITVLDPDELSATIDTNRTSCYGASDGTIAISNPTGGSGSPEAKIFWLKNAANTVVVRPETPYTAGFEFTGLAAGNYHVWMKDNWHGCDKDLGLKTIAEPAQLTATGTRVDVTCYGESTGQIIVHDAAGGVTGHGQEIQIIDSVSSSVIYGWTAFRHQVSGPDTNTFVGFAAGGYTVQIRDRYINSCSRDAFSIHVFQPGQLTATLGTDPVTCRGGSNGKVTVSSPTGGLGNLYQFKLGAGDWQNYTGGFSFSGLSAGNYTVYMRDSLNKSCERNLGSQTVIQPYDMSATVDTTGATCYGASNGIITVSSPDGGGYSAGSSAPYEFKWVGSGTNTGIYTAYTAPKLDLTGLEAGTYAIWMKHVTSGCEKNLGNFVITQPNQLNATSANDSVTCFGGANGSITITNPTGGVQGRPASGYEFEVMKGVDTVQVWTAFTAPSMIVNNLSIGTYAIYIRDKFATDCYRQIGSEIIYQPALMSASDSSIRTTCNGASDGQIVVYNPQGGQAPQRWEFRLMQGVSQIQGWTAYSDPSVIFSNLAAGTYHVWMRDQHDVACTIDLGAIVVNEPAPIVLSGYLKYNNTGNTPLRNFKVTLYNSGTPGAFVKTDVNGHYSFPTVCPGTYEIRPAVDSLLALDPVNETDAAMVSAVGFPVGFPWMKKVKFMAGDVDLNGILRVNDAYWIERHFMTTSAPDWTRPAWSFANPTDTTNINNSLSSVVYYPSVTINSGSGPVSKDILALYTGDFNGSWVGNAKSSGNLALNSTSTLMVEKGVEFELPIYATSALEIRAISMILDFPSDKLEITGAYLMNNPDVTVNFNLMGDQLRIGWFGNLPENVNTGERLLTLKLKLISDLAKDELITLNLTGSQLNELADGDASVIPNVVLYTSNIGAATIGMGDLSSANLGFANYPNPFTESTTFVYSLPTSGNVTIELFDMVGKKIHTWINEMMTAGDHTFVVNSNEITPGVYTATLSLNNDGKIVKRTIKIIRNR